MRRLIVAALVGVASASLDVVMAHYDGLSLPAWDRVMRSPFMQLHPPRWVVYNKGNPAAQFARLHPRVVVHPLPNIGRETHTYLFHIVHHYDALADFTLFTQEALDPDLNADVGTRLDSLFTPATSFLGLGIEHLCEVDNATWTGCHSRGNPHLQALYTWATETPPAKEFAFTASAVFLASRACIHRRPLKLYQELLALASANDTHAVFRTPHYRLGGHIHLPAPFPLGMDTQRDALWTRVNPYFGHVMERLWAPLMGCTQENAAPEPGPPAVMAHLKRRWNARTRRLLHCLAD